MDSNTAGKVTWFDLTVTNAEEVKNFYSEVTGWKPSPVPVGDYNDFNMNLNSGEPVAGICNKKGSNIKLPSYWLIYINVVNLDESLEKCRNLGGEIIDGPKSMSGYGKFCIIKDPAGAYCALFEPES